MSNNLFVTKTNLLLIVSGSVSLSQGASLDTSWAATTVWRLEGEVDVLLRIQTDDEGWDIDDLSADTAKNSMNEYTSELINFE